MTTIRVSDPVELVKVLPYQLGYHPRRSLAVVGLCVRRIALVQRLDLPAGPRHVAAAAEVAVGYLTSSRCTAAVVVVYEDEPGEGQAAGVALAESVAAAGIELIEHVVVRGGRVYFPRHRHPHAGVVLPADADVPAIADFVVLGANPCATREDVGLRVAAERNSTCSAVHAAVVRQRRRLSPETMRERALSDWSRFLGPPRVRAAPASAAAAARMAVSLTDVDVRDLLVTWLCPGLLSAAPFDGQPAAQRRARLPSVPRSPGDAPADATPAALLAAARESAAIVDRLCWLARHTPAGLAPAVLTVLGSYAWWLGDGALARAALDRALSIDPAYRLALLVEQVVSLAIRPCPRTVEVQALDLFDTPEAGSV